MFLEREWRSLGGFPNTDSVFPQVKPAMQVILLSENWEHQLQLFIPFKQRSK